MVRRVLATLLASLFLVSSIALAGIPVTEADSEIPYEFLGAVEVNESPGLLLNHVVGLFTLGFLAQSDEEVVKKQLRKRIARKAKLYNPDAVVNVVYSPLPEDPRFVKSKTVHAKGDMIKYKRAYSY